MESIPKTSQELAAWLPFVSKTVEVFDRKVRKFHGISQSDEDLVQDVLFGLLLTGIVEKFWEKATSETDRLLSSNETAGLLGLDPRAFRIRLYRDRKRRPQGVPGARNAQGQPFPKLPGAYLEHEPVQHARGSFYLMSEIIRWQSAFYPGDVVTFPTNPGNSVSPTVRQWQGYLATAVRNLVKNRYRYRSRRHRERPSGCFAQFISSDGENLFAERVCTLDNPENLLLQMEEERAKELRRSRRVPRV